MERQEISVEELLRPYLAESKTFGGIKLLGNLKEADLRGIDYRFRRSLPFE